MLILVGIGILFGAWKDKQEGLLKPVMCDYDRIETFLMVIFSFWFGMNLILKPYSLLKFISGSDKIDIGINITRIIPILLFGSVWLALGIYSLWKPTLINCQP